MESSVVDKHRLDFLGEGFGTLKDLWQIVRTLSGPAFAAIRVLLSLSTAYLSRTKEGTLAFHLESLKGLLHQFFLELGVFSHLLLVVFDFFFVLLHLKHALLLLFDLLDLLLPLELHLLFSPPHRILLLPPLQLVVLHPQLLVLLVLPSHILHLALLIIQPGEEIRLFRFFLLLIFLDNDLAVVVFLTLKLFLLLLFLPLQVVQLHQPLLRLPDLLQHLLL